MNTNSYEEEEQKWEDIKNIDTTAIEFNNRFMSVVSIKTKSLYNSIQER